MSIYEASITNPKKQLEFYKDLSEQLQQENQKLKKQLESANEQISYLRRSIERKEERIIDLQYTNEYVDKLLNQQNEFINYLEDKIDICDCFLDTVKSDLENTPYRVMSSIKKYITTLIKENEIGYKVYKEILDEAIEAAKKAEYTKNDLGPYSNVICYITSTKLFDTLCFNPYIKEIRIERCKNDKTN